ncbi:MAG TPA: BatD family protein [Gemmatimonadota bacterium]
MRRGVLAAAALLPAVVGILLSTAIAPAQEVSATIEPRLVPVGGIAELTIEVELDGVSGRIDEPALPELPAQVAVVGRARESRVEMNGLDVRRSTVFRYTLRGIEPGTVRIDPISVRIGAATRRSDPLVLLVVGDAEAPAAGRAPGSAPPIFVSARVDRPRAWTGQQVTLTFSFYHDPATPLAESPDYDPPQTPGFWRVELSGTPEISSERVGSRTYQVQRFRYALFPLRPGRAEIGPARVRVVQPDPDRWWEPGRPRVLATDPLVVTVDELPAGAPAGFGGAVGRYSISGGLPAPRATAGSPIELALTVRGDGNPATVDAPELPDWPGIDVGAPSVETETEIDGARLGGEATFRWILVPRDGGSLDLGAARMPYFDPDEGVYVVDTLELGELVVRPGSPASASSAPTGPARPTLWEAREPRRPRPRGLASTPIYWAAVAAPWLAWMALAAWKRRPRAAGSGNAERAAERIAAARRELQAEGSTAAEAAARAVERALESRYDVVLSGLPPKERRARLERRGAGRGVITAAEAARSALDGVRYGGIGIERAVGELDRLADRLRAESTAARRTSGAAGLWTALALAGGAVAPHAAHAAQATADSMSPAAVWAAANEAYRAGDLDGALRGYEAVAARHDDPRLDADRAAALWRLGRRGEALARYADALALAPRNGAIREDAERLWIELGRPARSGPVARALGLVRLDELLAGLLAASWLTVGAIALARARGSGRMVTGASATAAALAAALGLAAALHAWTIERADGAIALAGAELLAAPGGEVIAALPEGALVRVLGREADGWRVRAADLPAGWVAPDRIVPLD